MADACLLAILAPLGLRQRSPVMLRPMLSLLIAMIVGASTPSGALCADIVGTVLDTAGNRVAGIKVVAMRDRTGEVVGQATSGAKGEYYIPHIAPETYDLSLDPLGKPFQPATAVASVPKQGLTVDWRVSETAPASALAAPLAARSFVWDGREADLAGLIMEGAAGVGAGAIGGYAASGGSGGSGSPSSVLLLPAQSPSM
jgi:hypothetical protein